MTFTDAASVFVVEVVEDVVTAVFDDPMAPIDRENLLRRGHFLGAAGDAVGQFPAGFAGLFVVTDALDQEGLLYMGEIDELVDCLGDPNAPGFNSAMEGR